jgi:hypothetical protein
MNYAASPQFEVAKGGKFLQRENAPTRFLLISLHYCEFDFDACS